MCRISYPDSLQRFIRPKFSRYCIILMLFLIPLFLGFRLIKFLFLKFEFCVIADVLLFFLQSEMGCGNVLRIVASQCKSNVQ